MSGLLRRLTRRRPATADETGSPAPASSEPVGASAETPAEPGGGNPVPAPEDQATQVLPTTADQPAVAEPTPAAVPAQAETVPEPSPVRDLPAGIDPSELAVAPAASAGRGKLRRRLRYLRRVRELLLRDLGGFIFEIHRTAGGTVQEPHRRLVESKANRIAAIDAEVRGLEGRLAEPHETALLREPGIGGLCPECGELHASDAHYCSRCGAPLDAKARARRDAAVAAAAQSTTGSHSTVEPAPASVLWAAGPRPRGHTEPAAEEKTDPSAATSQWLALPGNRTDADATPPAPKDKPAGARDQTAAVGDETAVVANEPAEARDETAAVGDEAPTVAHEPPEAGDEAPAKPKRAAPRASRSRKPATKPKGFDPEPNGKRDEDVPPPMPSGDPLTSRREQGS